MKIPVVIFCGGMGTRMKEETEFRPKPMVTVGSKPILWHIMKIYSHYGFNEFIIALGYKGDYIKDYFLNQDYLQHDFHLDTKTGEKILYRKSNRKHDDFKITFVDTGQESSTGDRLLKVKKYIKTNIFMVTYGDGVSDINIKNTLHFFEEKNVIGVITGVHPKSKWGLIISSKDGIIKRFQEKLRFNQYVNGGFMIFTKKIFDYLKPRDMIHDAFPRLCKDSQLVVYIHDGFWSAMDTYQDVEELNKLWKRDAPWKIWK
jgi:glucose-1-phosphate cytidylyltransferase